RTEGVARRAGESGGSRGPRRAGQLSGLHVATKRRTPRKIAATPAFTLQRRIARGGQQPRTGRTDGTSVPSPPCSPRATSDQLTTVFEEECHDSQSGYEIFSGRAVRVRAPFGGGASARARGARSRRGERPAASQVGRARAGRLQEPD